MRTPSSNQLIEQVLKSHNNNIAKHFSSDVIAIKSPIRFGVDDVIRKEIEDLYADPTKRPTHLTVIIETTGGYIEVVERIYGIFRNHYSIVDFIVPNYAYSAGTVLVLSGDEIYMDYYSILGPIDPQYENEDDKFVPGLGYLQKFKELVDKINAVQPGQPDAKAELAYLIKKFDPATLFLLEQAKSHSESLLEEWLSKHKFKNWTVTTSGRVVDDTLRRQRAKTIGEVLGNPERWHSHGRGIGLRELMSEEIKLKIVDFGQDVALNKLIRQYYDVLTDFAGKLGLKGYIHTSTGIRRTG